MGGRDNGSSRGDVGVGAVVRYAAEYVRALSGQWVVGNGYFAGVGKM